MRKQGWICATLLMGLLVLDTHLARADWVQVGTAGFSAGDATDISFAIDGSGTPYVAYRDDANGYKASVMKFDGSKWVQVGIAGFSAGNVNYTNLAIDGNGTPYVAYNDYGNGGGASVMKFDGSNWVQVGAAGFASSWHLSLALDKDGTPYVAYGDATNDYKMSVMKFDGSSWVQVGVAGFSDGYGAYVSLAIDSIGNNPYVAYEEDGYKGSSMRFDGSTWVKVGTDGFAYWVAHSSLAFDSGGTLHVAYGSYPVNDSYPANVKKLDGSDWMQVGMEDFFDAADYVSLAFDRDDTPYVACSDVDMNEGSARKANVMKFDGSNWVQVGMADIYASSDYDYHGNNISLAIDGSGVPYVAYRDGANGNKVSVMKFMDNSDADNDGITDANDNCPNTASGDVVNSSGCSIVQICPCNSNWRNRSRYIQCVQQASGEFLTANLITKKEQREVSTSAAKSQCGRKGIKSAATSQKK